MALNCTWRAPGLLGPGAPPALVFRNDEMLLDVVPAGMHRKRRAWLPSWFPGNSWMDYSEEGCRDAACQWVAEYAFMTGRTTGIEIKA